jgi:hypothetical protein
LAPVAQLQTYTAQLNRARLSSDDFEEASQYIANIDDVQDDVLKRALLTAAIVAYSRPFTNNSGGLGKHATSQLSVSLRRLFTVKELEFHDKLLALRNEVVAHIDYDRKPVRRLEGTAAGFTMSGKPFDLLSERIDVKLFREMCAALKQHCVDRMMELNRKIVAIENAH